MITAKEAKRLSDTATKSICEHQLQIAEKCIGVAAGQGRYSCYFNGVLGKEAQEVLKECGYNLNNRTNYFDGNFWEIGWEANQEKYLCLKIYVLEFLLLCC